MQEALIQITSGRGPLECCRVVARVQELMLKDARKQSISLTVLESKKAELNGTLLSATLIAKAENLDTFVKEWRGSILWIAQSPYRKFHKRKNWFVGVETFEIKASTQFNINDVKFETCRSSGPGGQNVNKVETAVRATHIPSGLQVLAMDSRSQLQNKKLCIERLQAKVLSWQTEQMLLNQQNHWQEHNSLERGNAVKVFQQAL